MKITKAKSMGFCYGVKNAVKLANEFLDKEKFLISYGEITHNQDVINKLSEKGLEVIYDIEDALGKEKRVLIRAHGVGKNIIDFLESNKIEYIDTTCVRVKKIHDLVYEYSSKGYEIIVIGNSNHPEVQGIRGWSENKLICVNNLKELKNVEINRNNKYCMVCQTTFNHNIYKEIVEFLIENDYTNIVRFNTICDATQKRQESCIDLARVVDLMLVIGGKKSSNTKKLYDLSSQYCKNAFLIENYREIPYKYIDKNTKIGITAGASTPDWVIEEVIQYVRKPE